MNGVIGFWTDERRDEVKRRWFEGESASRIAEAMGAHSRNAVIGIINRLGLAGQRRKPKPRVLLPKTRQRVPFEKPKPKRLPRTIPVVEAPAIYPTSFTPRETDVAPLHISFAELHDWHCKYPYGDRDFTYCGHPASIGPYCSAHGNLCYTPAALRPAQKDRVRQKVNF